MPNPWYPDALRIDGEHAHYEAGQIIVTTGLCHFTVGRNSRGTCGRDFQFLQERDGVLVQGAPIDARCFGAGDPWNECAVHYEVEYLPGFDDVVFTDPARAKTRDFAHWLNSEWGVPLNHWGGVRIPAWNGWVDHGSVIQTGDYHTDGWPEADCLVIFDSTPPPPQRKKKHMNWIAPGPHPDKPINWYRDGIRSYLGDPGTQGFLEVTLKAAGEPLYVQTEQVSEDFHESFTLVGPDYKPSKP